MEAITGTVIATIAILGLAHSFGIGRALINRYEVARVALGVAQSRIETLRTEAQGAPDFDIGVHGPYDFAAGGATLGREYWTVAWVDDPIDGTGGGDPDGGRDLKRVVVTVAWGQGIEADSLQVSGRFLP